MDKTAPIIETWFHYKCFTQAHQFQDQLFKSRVLCNNPSDKERTMGKFSYQGKQKSYVGTYAVIQWSCQNFGMFKNKKAVTLSETDTF